MDDRQKTKVFKALEIRKSNSQKAKLLETNLPPFDLGMK
jgi:hypothetical protein